MINAYVVRDPQGRMIGISVYKATSALSDALNTTNASARIALSFWSQMGVQFIEEGSANIGGYTLTREQVAL